MKGYEKYLPKKQDEETKAVQAKIPVSLHGKLAPVLESNGWTWNEFMLGLMEKFLDESRPGRRDS